MEEAEAKIPPDSQNEQLENKTPLFLMSQFRLALDFLSLYGWWVLFVVVGITLLWAQIEPLIRKWKEKRKRQQEEAEMYRNPELIMEKQIAMEKARQKLQEQHDRLAAEHLEKLKEREEMKRREKIEEWERLQQGKAYRSKQRFNDTAEPALLRPEGSSEGRTGRRLRDDYNPLMGSGGSCFRPRTSGSASGRGG